MKRLNVYLSAFFVLFLLSACNQEYTQKEQEVLQEQEQEQEQTEEKQYVVLVSLDGYRADYSDMHNAYHLNAIGEQHVEAQGLIPCFPSKTFPNHYSIATGMYPQNHGIVGNHFYNPSKDQFYSMSKPEYVTDGSWYHGTPLWVLAEKAGMKAASMFWVGSEAEIQGIRPSYYYEYAKDSHMSNEERLEKVVEWLMLPEEERPQFLTLYFSDVDNAGHRYGPEAYQTKNAVQYVDRLIGELEQKVDTMDIPVNLIVVSDHGMAEVNRSQPIYMDSYVDLSKFRYSVSGTFWMLYSENQSLLESTYQELKANENHYKVYKKSEVPEKYHYSQSERIGDLVIIADHPYVLARNNQTFSPGTHGYDPAEQSMHGIFYAKGPAFKEKVNLPAFENIHIYPLIARILDLPYDEEAIDGKLEVLYPVLNTDSLSSK